MIAVTGQERTGPVMEAATWGAYEIMHGPSRKERIERVLRELQDLKQEMGQPGYDHQGPACAGRNLCYCRAVHPGHESV